MPYRLPGGHPATESPAFSVLNLLSLGPRTTLRVLHILTQYSRSGLVTATSPNDTNDNAGDTLLRNDGSGRGLAKQPDASDTCTQIDATAIGVIHDAMPAAHGLSDTCKKLRNIQFIHQTEVIQLNTAPQSTSSSSSTFIYGNAIHAVGNLLSLGHLHRTVPELVIMVLLEQARPPIIISLLFDQSIFTISEDVLQDLQCVLFDRFSEWAQPRKKSNAVRKKSFGSLTMHLQIRKGSGNECPMIMVPHPPKPSIATMTISKRSEGILWACPIFKVNPSLAPECQDVYFRTEESLRHARTGHLDSKHADLWYVRDRLRRRFRNGTPVDYWRWSLISIFPRYSAREALLNPHHGTRLIQDESDEIELREIQMMDLRLQELDREYHQHNVEMNSAHGSWNHESRCMSSHPNAPGPAFDSTTLNMHAGPSNAAMTPSILSWSRETSLLEPSNKVPGRLISSATSFTPVIAAPQTEHKSIGDGSFFSDQFAGDQIVVTPQSANLENNDPGLPQATHSESVIHNPFPSLQSSRTRLPVNEGETFPRLHHDFEIEMQGHGEVVQDEASLQNSDNVDPNYSVRWSDWINVSDESSHRDDEEDEGNSG